MSIGYRTEIQKAEVPYVKCDKCGKEIVTDSVEAGFMTRHRRSINAVIHKSAF